MSTRLVPRVRGLALSALLVIAGGGCVDPFGGAFIEVVFDSNVETPAPLGQTPTGARPPADTHYSFYAVQYEYASCDACPGGSTCDTDVNLCLDDTTSRPVVVDSFAFKVVDFEIKPLIATQSPCFIEHPERPYPGLHATREVNRLALDLGISLDTDGNPVLPDDVPKNDEIDILTAAARRSFHNQLQNEVRAVTSFSNALAPGRHPEYMTATTCVEVDPNVDPNLIPPAQCILDASNARRLELCSRYWDENPEFYEGSDLVFTLPLSGEWRGAVSGINPKNGVGFLDGATFLVEPSLDSFDALLVQWQYKDINGDGAPDYPDSVPAQERSNIGFHYMEGAPVSRTRGVVSVPLSNRVFTVTGDAAIFPSLAEDDVHF